MERISDSRLETILRRFESLYGKAAPGLLRRFEMMLGRYGVGVVAQQPGPKWDAGDVMLITYADMVRREGERPLVTLRDFVQRRTKGVFSVVHILPFYPWSSDDGFSVIDYRAVDQRYGTWEDIQDLGGESGLMFDLVLNHCSSESAWFRDYVGGICPARHYFHEVDPETDLSEVVRPRPYPLLTRTQTRDGETHVWTTFSPDQVDLNFSNPDVLFEFLDILLLYISQGARFLRLDAIAYLWKELGTTCIHLPQTHEVVKLLRDVVDITAPAMVLLTETNVPHEENVSYFGQGDEAHMVYQFSLPPLGLHGLLRGDAGHLTAWAAGLSDPPEGCTYLNFTASHDGIGVRPLEGILSDDELEWLVSQVRTRGGLVSTRTQPGGGEKPYELNVTYFGALSEPENPELGIARFLCSQAVALGMKGIPAVYFHSLVGTPNYLEGVETTGHARTINRRKWDIEELDAALDESGGVQAKVNAGYLRMIKVRRGRSAFHPDAGQKIHDLGPELFAFVRSSVDGSEKILCVHNFTAKKQEIPPGEITGLLGDSKGFQNLLTGKAVASGGGNITLKPYQAMWLLPA